MDNYVCFLISILCGDQLLKCALKVKSDELIGDCALYPMEPENRKILHALLPEHVRKAGNIVDVDEIFEVKIY